MAVDDLRYKKKRGPNGERIPTKDHGKRKSPWRVRWVDPVTGGPETRFFAKEADAKAFDAEIQAGLTRGDHVDPRAGSITVAEYAEQWRRQQVHHRDSTAERIERAFRLHIVPALGGLPLNWPTMNDAVKNWLTALTDEQEIPPATVRGIYAPLRAMFLSAQQNRLIAVNPCAGVKAPPLEDGELAVPSTADVSAIVAALPQRYQALVILAAASGLRIGELCGLETTGVRFLQRDLVVTQQLKRPASGQLYIGAPKTKKSRRTVELGHIALDAVSTHLARFPAEPVTMPVSTGGRKTPRPVELVFTNTRGTPITSAAWSKIWRAALERAGLAGSGYTTHGLRHFFATLLISNGASVRNVQLQLGHSTPTTTLNVYTHYWPDQLDRTRTVVDAELGAGLAA